MEGKEISNGVEVSTEKTLEATTAHIFRDLADYVLGFLGRRKRLSGKVVLDREAVEYLKNGSWRVEGGFQYGEPWPQERIRASLKRLLSVADRNAKIALLNAEEAKNAAYKERNQLVALLSKMYPSHLCRHDANDKAWDNAWRWIVCVHIPMEGKEFHATWHIQDDELDAYFSHLPIKPNDWMGDTTEQKYAELKGFVAQS